MSDAKILEELERTGIRLFYGEDLGVLVEPHMLEEARTYIAQRSAEERTWMMNHIEEVLGKALVRVRSGKKIQRRQMDSLVGDMLLWSALKEHLS